MSDPVIDELEQRPLRLGILSGDRDPDAVVQKVLDLVRGLSMTSDARELSDVFTGQVAELFEDIHTMAMSRRDVEAPNFVVTRHSRWEDPADPWTQKDQLPVLQGGLVGSMIFSDEPHFIQDAFAGSLG